MNRFDTSARMYRVTLTAAVVAATVGEACPAHHI